MQLISTASELSPLFNDIDNCQRFAIDLEFIPEKTFRPVLALIQIATTQSTYIIDPLVNLPLADLWQRVADPLYSKVLHAAREDLNIIFQLSGLMPNNIFDTQVAAGFIGLGYQIGYKNLLAQALNVRIDKSESFTDWLARPLTPVQLQYASEDVCHLLPLADKLMDLLKKEGRLTWAKEECIRLFNEMGKSQEFGFTKIKGARSLSRRKLAILKALCDLRSARGQ